MTKVDGKKYDYVERQKVIFKDWLCVTCSSRQYVNHIVQHGTTNFKVEPPTCCETPMNDYATLMRVKNHKIGIIKDIDPYMTIAADKKTGEQVYVKSRREHEEFLRRNNYSEVGNEKIVPLDEKPFTPISDDLDWAIHNAPQVTQSDEFKSYIYNANKGLKA